MVTKYYFRNEGGLILRAFLHVGQVAARLCVTTTCLGATLRRELAIREALPSVSSFFYIFFFMIAQRTMILGSTGSIFAIFSENESVLSVDD